MGACKASAAAGHPLTRTRCCFRRHSGRLAKQGVQQARAERLAQSLDATDLSHICSDTDKIFCSVSIAGVDVLSPCWGAG